MRLTLRLQHLQRQFQNITALQQSCSLRLSFWQSSQQKDVLRVYYRASLKVSCHRLGDTANKQEQDSLTVDSCSPANNDKSGADGVGWNAGCRQTQTEF